MQNDSRNSIEKNLIFFPFFSIEWNQIEKND